MTPRLVLTVQGRRHSLDGLSELSIGRDVDATVPVEDERVSRRHARVAPGVNGWVFEDTSRNGSFVGGQLVRSIELDVGLRIRLASPIDGPVIEVVNRSGTADWRSQP